jgi:HSP20 family protein
MKNLIPWSRPRDAVVRSENVHPLIAWHEEVSRFLNGFWRDLEGPSTSFTAMGFPRVEVSESDAELTIEADLPGLDEKDVELLLDDGMLTIRGEKRSVREDKSRRVSERFYGRFERRLALPAGIEEEKVRASFSKGVLTITVPKAPEAVRKGRRIPINDG